MLAFRGKKISTRRRESIVASIAGLLFVLVFFLLLEGHGIFAEDLIIGDITNNQFFFLSALAFLLYAVILLIAYRGFRTSVHWGWLFFALALAIGNTVAVTLNCKDVYFEGNLVLAFTDVLKARYIIVGLLNAMLFYFLFAILPRVVGGTFFPRLVLKGLVVVAFFSFFASLLLEFEVWKEFFTTFDIGNEGISGLYRNKNIFATVLFIGFAAEMILVTGSPRWWRWLLAILLALIQVPLLSRTQVIITAVLILILPLLAYARSLKAHKIRNNVLLALVLIAFAALIAVWTVPGERGSSDLFDILKDFFTSVLTNGSQNLLARISLAKEAMDAVNGMGPLATVFGLGFKSSLVVLYSLLRGNPSSTVAIDIEWVYAFVNAGALGMALELLLWLAGLIIILKAMVRGNRESQFALILYFAILARTFVESGGLMLFDAWSLGFYGVILMIPLVHNHHHLHPEVGEQVIEDFSNQKTAAKRLPYRSLRLALSASAIPLVFLFPYVVSNPFFPHGEVFLYFLSLLAYAIAGTYSFGSYKAEEGFGGRFWPLLFGFLLLLNAILGPLLLPPVASMLVSLVLPVAAILVIGLAGLGIKGRGWALLYLPFAFVIVSSSVFAYFLHSYVAPNGFYHLLLTTTCAFVYVLVYVVAPFECCLSGFDGAIIYPERAYERLLFVSEGKLAALYERKIEKKGRVPFRRQGKGGKA